MTPHGTERPSEAGTDASHSPTTKPSQRTDGPMSAGMAPPHPTSTSITFVASVTASTQPTLKQSRPRINTLRGVGPSAFNAQKTHCPNGHAYDESNTRNTPAGGRACRACLKVRKRTPRRIKETI